MKLKKIVFLFLMMFVCSVFVSAELGAKAAKTTAVKKVAVKKATKKTTKKKVKGKEEAVNEEAPKEDTDKDDETLFKEVSISPSVVDALLQNDISGALLSLRDEKISPKALYLTREVMRISNFLVDKKPARADAHRTYQNVGVAYHNLYLFLKTKGYDQKEFAKEAKKYYSKAKGTATKGHKNECVILIAAIEAASGEKEKAEKKVSKLKLNELVNDFSTVEYLAAYYAAMGDVAQSTEMLHKAYNLNPGMIRAWIAIGDDFYFIKDSPEFKTLFVTWKASDVGKRLALTARKSKKAKAKASDDDADFRPQKVKKHYDIKKSKKKKTPAVKSSAKNKKPAVRTKKR